MPFPCEVCVLQIPGSVLKRAITETRAPALQNPPVILGRYAQTDDSISWDPVTNTVTAIRKQPVDDNKLYSLAIPHVLATGALLESPPIVEYCNTLPPGSIPNIDACIGAKNIIVSSLSKSLLFGCIESIGLANITGDDDQISKEELVKAIEVFESKSGKQGLFTDKEVVRIIVNNLFAVADLDGSGFISKKELVALRMSMVGNMEWDNLQQGNATTIRAEDAAAMVAKSLGLSVDDPVIVETMKTLDANGSGEVTTVELRAYIQSQVAVGKNVII
jgi:Ca2+-binding EF-hand superfamily protein